MGESMRLKVLVAVAVVLAAAVVWRMTTGSGDGASALDPDAARIEELRQKGDTAALAKQAESPNVRVACLAVTAMGRVGADARPHVEKALQDARPQVRQKAAAAFASVGDRRKSAPVAELARADESPEVRASAVRALGTMFAYTEMETLLDALEDDDVGVRRRANAAIRRILNITFGFKATDPPAKRREAVAEMRLMWVNEKPYTERYYNSPRFRDRIKLRHKRPSTDR